MPMETQPIENQVLNIEWTEQKVPVSSLIPYENNPRTISAHAFKRLKSSLKDMGYHQRIIVQPDLRVIGGHQRITALQELGIAEITVLVPSRELTVDEFRKLLITDNLPFGDFDFGILATDFKIDELKSWGMPDDWMVAVSKATAKATAGNLSDRFGIAPFSVLNAREGWWQNRKATWLAIGIESEVGRGDNLLKFSETVKLKRAQNNDLRGDALAMRTTTDPYRAKTFSTDGNIAGSTGTSIFDPVLCEIAYRWFCPPEGQILDPFSGGSVRGIVAGRLGRKYHGIDLRKEQVEANREQAARICPTCGPEYTQGDSLMLVSLLPDLRADFVFSCPPYADLEVYSNDPADLSTMPYEDFLLAYRQIIKNACGKLKDDRFACFVVGEIRDKTGAYRNFVGDTVHAFIDAGLKFYNEAILITMVGSLPLRVGKQFTGSRKLGKTHQNVLIFVKGDPKKATAAIGECEFAPLSPDLQAEGELSNPPG